MKSRSCSILFGIAYLCGANDSRAWSQLKQCDLQATVELSNFDGTLTDAIKLLSKNSGLSVSMEVPSYLNAVHIAEGSHTIEEVVHYVQPSLLVRCEGNSALHIFDRSVVASRANALNFKFSYFQIPPNFDEFKSDLIARLSDEPWAKSPPLVIQSGQGYLPDDRKDFALKEEGVRDISARNLIFRVAGQQRIVLIVKIDMSHTLRPEAAWRKAQDTWYFEAPR